MHQITQCVHFRIGSIVNNHRLRCPSARRTPLGSLQPEAQTPADAAPSINRPSSNPIRPFALLRASRLQAMRWPAISLRLTQFGGRISSQKRPLANPRSGDRSGSFRVVRGAPVRPSYAGARTQRGPTARCGDRRRRRPARWCRPQHRPSQTPAVRSRRSASPVPACGSRRTGALSSRSTGAGRWAHSAPGWRRAIKRAEGC